MTFTKERLQEIAEDGFLKHGESKELARIVLAARTAEPVGYFGRFDADDEDLIDQCSPNISGAFPLYAATPAPVVPPAIEPDYDVIKGILPTSNPDEYACCIAADMWNACRSAMLQGAEPVNQPYTLPANVIDALEKALQAMSFMGDTLNALDAVCEEDVEYVTPAFEAVREVLQGAAPVQEWIQCSERMPEIEGHYLVWVNASNLDGYCDHQAMATYQGGEWSNEFNWLVTHWMPLPAEPQQGVNK